MEHRYSLTEAEVNNIRDLLRQKCAACADKQKGIRRRIRDLGFHISDFGHGFCVDDFDRLIQNGLISIADGNSQLVVAATHTQSNVRERDERYIISLCDEVLGTPAIRQHHFDFLRGDAGTLLPVDAYYPSLELVIEYRERQHAEAVSFFDRRMAISGIGRREQRALYDQRRREVLPKNGVTLVELSYDEFVHGPNKRLLRHREKDVAVLRMRLNRWVSRS